MGATQRERVWLIAGALGGLVLVLIGYFFFISPQNGQTSTAQGRVNDARARNVSLNRHLSQLEAQNKNLAGYKQQLEQSKLALPDSSGLPDFLRTLQTLGSSTLVSISSLTVSPPTEVMVAPATSNKPTRAPSAGTSAPSAASVGKVYALPITVTATGTYAQLDQFLTQLQSVQPRAVLVTDVTQTATEGKSVTLQLNLQAFVAPSNAAETTVLSGASR